MLVRGVGIRDIAEIKQVSTANALSVLIRSECMLTPKRKHYQELEVDEFWTFVGAGKNKVWLTYAYEWASGEIVAHVWGKA